MWGTFDKLRIAPSRGGTVIVDDVDVGAVDVQPYKEIYPMGHFLQDLGGYFGAFEGEADDVMGQRDV